MKKIIIAGGLWLAFGQLSAQNTIPTGTQNYIYTKNCLDADCIKKKETVQYFDGLGRPKQVVGVKASPARKDVVTHIEYDPYGKMTKSYLPVPQAGTQNGAIYERPLEHAVAPDIYGAEKIYAEQIIENAPLDRVKQSFGIGTAWADKPVNYNYNTNTSANEVKKYTVTTGWIEGRTDYPLSFSGYYGINTLMKTSVTDEDGNTATEYKNGKGQTILIRKNDGINNTDTHYVYDEYGQLAYVIPPLAAASEIIDEAGRNNLCYQYRYDEFGRLVEKKLPGKGWEYMVYDKAGRLVLTQDANLEEKGQWILTKYDSFGRVAYTAVIFGMNRVNMQSMASVNLIVENRHSAGFTQNGMQIQYTNNYFHILEKVLTVNYYDTYPQGYDFSPPFPSSVLGVQVLTDAQASQDGNTKGLPVLSLIKNIEDDNWTKNFVYYDTKGRIISGHTVSHLGGYTKTETLLDFAGLPQKTVTRHKRLSSDTERVITQNFTYDDQSRLLVHKHQIDGKPEEILAQNTYNELSQLKTRKIGGTDPGSPLQAIDYRYNIKGWLTKINDPANLNGKLFGYEVKYHNPEYNTKAQGRFNGNIAEIDWKNASEGILKRYTYAYDGLNRLKNAFYAEPDATNPHNGNYDEYLTYDLNGNIRTLKRKAFPLFGTTSTMADDLEYRYTGNRLNQVIEYAMNDTGYEGGNNTIGYDLNGSMTDMKDKGIQSIAYNHLDLPDAVSVKQAGLGGIINISIDHLYRADGTKLRKTYKHNGGKGALNSLRITDYLDGFQYTYYDLGGICMTCKTESALEEQAYKGIGEPGIGTPEWKLDFIPTSEGFYSFAENRYIYQYRDHLGNARVSYARNSEGTPEITDTNNYYPFGLNHTGGNGINSSNFGSYYSYKYNGKELQETGMFDYGARFYMPDLGRWGVIDPMAEPFPDITPYRYGFNNPIIFSDPNGMLEKNALDEMFSKGGFWTNTGNNFNNGRHYVSYNGEYSFADKILEIPEVIVPAGKGTARTWNDRLNNGIDSFVMYSKFTSALMQSTLNQNRSLLYSSIENTKVGQSVSAAENFLFLELPGSFAGGELLAAGWRAAGISKFFTQFAKGALQYGTKGDIFLMNASKISKIEGVLDVAVHGSSKTVQIGDLTVNHRFLANLISRNPEFAGQPIRLLSCNTGKLSNGFAQNLANKLGVPVYAPNNIIWAFSNGSFTIGPSPFINSGSLVKFVPGL